MDEAGFPQTIMGLVSSITTPLLSSLILIDCLINEDVDSVEDYGKMLLINEQIQSSIEYFLEIRALTLNKIGSQLINNKSKAKRKEMINCKKINGLSSYIVKSSEIELINQTNNEDTKKKWRREFFSGILIVINIGILIWQTYKILPI